MVESAFVDSSRVGGRTLNRRGSRTRKQRRSWSAPRGLDSAARRTMGLMISATENAATPVGIRASASAASDARRTAARDMPAAVERAEVRRAPKRVRFPASSGERGFRARSSQTVSARAGGGEGSHTGIQASGSTLTRTRESARRDVSARVCEPRSHDALASGKNKAAEEFSAKKKSGENEKRSPFVLAHHQMRSRRGSRAKGLARDIAILFAMKTVEAISWVHNTVRVGVHRVTSPKVAC